LGIDAAAPDANDGINISISGMLQRWRISRREAGSLGIIERYLAELVAPPKNGTLWDIAELLSVTRRL
jgi:hypothetical protein